MTKRQSNGKSILFWIFLLVSIPIAIFIIAYASGLRFDKNTHTLIENAGISITTTPRGAEVLVHNTPLSETTPVVHSLLPGMYTITLRQDHHFDWKKNITVQPGKSEVFTDVILFAQTTPIVVDTIPEKSSFVALPKKNDGQQLRSLEGSQILLTDPEHDISFIVKSLTEMTPLFSIHNRVLAAMWNQEGSLLYATDTELSIYTPKKENELLRRQSLPFIDVAWHPENQYVFYSDLTGIYALELDTRDVRQRWKLADVGDAEDLIVSDAGDTLYYRSGETNYSLQLY